jgi:hypothetical protein
MQVDFIKRIWESLDNEHQTIQTEILQVLIGKLNIIITKLNKLSKTESDNRTTDQRATEIKRWKYVLIKTGLDEAIKDLASWQNMFDPTWFLVMKVSNPVIDQELGRTGSAVSSITTSASNLRDALREAPRQRHSVFLPSDGLETTRMREVAYATVRCVPRVSSDKWVVVDCIPCDPEADVSLVTRDIRELARKLSSVDPLIFGILQCRGVIRIIESSSGRPSSFDFVFPIPSGLSNEPRSLRWYLSEGLDHTLTDRFRLAKQVAKSISYVHTLGYVHKNLRPETVLGFPTTDSAFGMFFLVGFEQVRIADGRFTRRSGDTDWEKNLYRHPHRQGLNPEDIYTMQHDIYSLGVCLLEIGLWESFVSYEETVSPLPTAALGITADSLEFKEPVPIKEHLVALAKRDLPKRMGERYEEIVVNCLTCLDEDNADFGDQTEFEDPDGILVGVKYIRKVCQPSSAPQD